MELRTLGTSTLRVSPVCMGTMTFGEQNTEADAHAQLDYAWERGVNFVDVAEMYPVPTRADTYGRSEEIVGSWLRDRPRDRVVVATKVAGPSQGRAWVRGGSSSLDRASVRAALEASLRRLGTDYVDLYQIHWPARSVPVFGGYKFVPAPDETPTPMREQLEGLGELVQEGKIRFVGVSNEQPWGVMEFIRLAAGHGLPRIVSTQNAFNLVNRTSDFGLSEVLYREHVGLLAYSPLAFGHLTGKYLDQQSATGRVALFPNFGLRYKKGNVMPAVRAYAQLARESGLTPVQLALAYVYHHWSVTSTIIGATTMDQLRENVAAWDTTIGADLLDKIDAIHLQYPNPGL